MEELIINTNNLVVPINSLKANEYNPKLDFRTDENNLKEYEKIKKSLLVAGQIDPILVRELEDGTYEIVNGYHRWEAMKELGFKEVEIKNLGKIDLDTAISRALLTEDTKVPIDNIELAELMKRVVTVQKPIEYWARILPYPAELIQAKIDLINFDYSKYNTADTQIDLKNLSYTFKFQDEQQLAKVKDYFGQFPDNERAEALVQLIQ
jgi:hypothetical protein